MTTLEKAAKKTFAQAGEEYRHIESGMIFRVAMGNARALRGSQSLIEVVKQQATPDSVVVLNLGTAVYVIDRERFRTEFVRK